MNWTKSGSSFVAVLFFLIAVDQVLGLKNAFPTDVILMIYLPCIFVALYAEFRKIDVWPAVLQSTGISIGIFVSILWFVNLLMHINSPQETLAAISRSFMAVLHGGFISTVGYFLTSDLKNEIGVRYKTDYVVFIFIAMSVPVLEIWFSKTVPAAYLDTTTVLLFSAPLVLFFALGRDQMSGSKFLRAVVVSMLGPALLSIVAYVAGADDPKAIGPASALGMLGLLYGAFCLFVFGCVMPSNLSNREDLWRAKLHALEIYALVILIIFAPPSILEGFN